MGNRNSYNPIAVAFLATVSVGLQISAGSLCNFVSLSAVNGEVLTITNTSKQNRQSSTSFGIMCQGDFYTLDSDIMWTLSRVFFFSSLCFALLATAVAWAICLFLTPTKFYWRSISYIGALGAVLQVPVFLIFEVFPCSDFTSVQKCKLSTGSYLLIASVACWVFNTMATQFLDPPAWGEDIELWKRPRETSSFSGSNPPQPKRINNKRSAQMVLNINSTSSMTGDEEEGGIIAEEGVNSSMYDISFTRDADLDSFRFKNSPVKQDVRSKELEIEIESFDPFAIEGDESLLDGDGSAKNNSFSRNDDANIAAGIDLRTSPGTSVNAVPKPVLQDATSSPTYSVNNTSKIPSNESALTAPNEGIQVANDKPLAAGIFALTDKLIQKNNFRRAKLANGYALMDDDDSVAPFPIWSPPIDFVAFEQDIGDRENKRSISAEDEDEQKLLDNWNVLHNIETTGVKTIDSDEGLTDDEGSSGGGSSFDDIVNREREGFAVYGQTEENNPRKQISRAKRRRKKHRGLSSGSVASSPSLLDVTIEEETLTDLEGSDGENQKPEENIALKRSLSAPNLARYAISTDRYNVSEELFMTGMHSYHRAEVYRVDGGRSINSVEEKKDDDFIQETPQKERTRIWRDEKISRANIHTHIIEASSSESSDERVGNPSLSRVDTRTARIRRLQQQSVMFSRRRSRTLEPPKRGRDRLPPKPVKRDARRVQVVSPDRSMKSAPEKLVSPPNIEATSVAISATDKSTSFESAKQDISFESALQEEYEFITDDFHEPKVSRGRNVSSDTALTVDTSGIQYGDYSQDSIIQNTSRLGSKLRTNDKILLMGPTVLRPQQGHFAEANTVSPDIVSRLQSSSGTFGRAHFAKSFPTSRSDFTMGDDFVDDNCFDDLDVSLVHLYRPDDAEYGPEEESV